MRVLNNVYFWFDSYCFKYLSFFSVIAYSLKMVFMSFPTLLCPQLRGYLVKCKLLTDGETLGGKASLVASHC